MHLGSVGGHGTSIAYARDKVDGIHVQGIKTLLKPYGQNKEKFLFSDRIIPFVIVLSS